MNPGKLKKRLAREIRANPQKAAVLALLVGVAAYFWVPLVLRMVPKGAEAALPPPPVGVPGSMEVVNGTRPAAPPAPAGPPQYTWMQLNEWMEQSPMTKAGRLSTDRDPFRSLRREMAEAEAKQHEEEKVQAPPPPEVTPASLGMVVTGTICGSARRAVLINGRAFSEGEVVSVRQEGKQAFEFTVLRVLPAGAVLEREGKQYELAIVERKATGRIELSLHSP